MDHHVDFEVLRAFVVIPADFAAVALGSDVGEAEVAFDFFPDRFRWFRLDPLDLHLVYHSVANEVIYVVLFRLDVRRFDSFILDIVAIVDDEFLFDFDALLELLPRHNRPVYLLVRIDVR